MNNQFDELTKSLAQSVTRRAALKKFGLGLAGMALACFGLTNSARAGGHCPPGYVSLPGSKLCWKLCQTNSDCQNNPIQTFTCCRYHSPSVGSICVHYIYCTRF